MITRSNCISRYFSIIVFLLAGCGAESGPTAQSSSAANNSNDQDDTSIDFNRFSVYDPAIYVANYNYFGRWEKGQKFSSTITGITYGYEVYLPPEYDLEPERNFSVMYVTDAQYDVSFHAKVLDNEHRPIIMVGINEGPASRRAVDYILPGAEKYFQFFTEEFIPAIENQYRIRASDRTFEGSSAGGHVTLAMLFLDIAEPPIFKRHIAFDPYITSKLRTLIHNRATSGDVIDKVLFISAAYGDRGLGRTVTPFIELSLIHI